MTDEARDPGEPPVPASVVGWREPEPGRVMGKGHPAGDFLEAWKWQLLESGDGFLHIRCHLPDHVRNLRGQLFGGFTPAYVDLASLFAVRAGQDTPADEQPWLATTNMRVDYFEPVLGPEFLIKSQVVKRRGRTVFVETRLLDLEGELTVFATTTLRTVRKEAKLGDG